MAVENGWCGGVDKGERMRDDLIAATIDWFQTASQRDPSLPIPPCTPRLSDRSFSSVLSRGAAALGRCE